MLERGRLLDKMAPGRLQLLLPTGKHVYIRILPFKLQKAHLGTAS